MGGGGLIISMNSEFTRSFYTTHLMISAMIVFYGYNVVLDSHWASCRDSHWASCRDSHWAMLCGILSGQCCAGFSFGQKLIGEFEFGVGCRDSSNAHCLGVEHHGLPECSLCGSYSWL